MVHYSGLDLKGKCRGFIPHGKKNVIQKWIVDVQPEIVQFKDPVTGERVTMLISHGDAVDSSNISTYQSAYPGIIVG